MRDLHRVAIGFIRSIHMSAHLPFDVQYTFLFRFPQFGLAVEVRCSSIPRQVRLILGFPGFLSTLCKLHDVGTCYLLTKRFEATNSRAIPCSSCLDAVRDGLLVCHDDDDDDDDDDAAFYLRCREAIHMCIRSWVRGER